MRGRRGPVEEFRDIQLRWQRRARMIRLQRDDQARRAVDVALARPSIGGWIGDESDSQAARWRLLQQAERDADDIGSVWFEDDGAAIAVKHHGLALSECGRGAQNRK